MSRLRGMIWPLSMETAWSLATGLRDCEADPWAHFSPSWTASLLPYTAHLAAEAGPRPLFCAQHSPQAPEYRQPRGQLSRCQARGTRELVVGCISMPGLQKTEAKGESAAQTIPNQSAQQGSDETPSHSGSAHAVKRPRTPRSVSP